MLSVVDVAVLVVSVTCGIGAVITALVAYRQQAAMQRASEQLEAGLAQLEKWRQAGLLVMSEEAFQEAAEVGRFDPRQLHNLVRTTEWIMEREELGPGEAIMLTVKVEYDEKPERAARLEPPTGHLELVATFA